MFAPQPGEGRVDRTSINFISRLISSVIYVMGISAALIQIPEFKIIGHSLLAGAGTLTVLCGLASQQVLSNLTSGTVIVFLGHSKWATKLRSIIHLATWLRTSLCGKLLCDIVKIIA
ncbi:MAG: hypothetical protein ACI9C4_000343 [Paraglaciecola sp.]|jgi:hypothetical protein